MALILNLETATAVCSVALAKDGNVLALKETREGNTHAENLAVLIDKALKSAAISIDTIDAVAVSKGPGSYTGLRIGVSTAKGICFALNKPLIAINTLEAMASNQISLPCRQAGNFNHPFIPSLYKEGEGGGPNLFCPMIDARRMEVYCAIFDSNGKMAKDVAAEIIDENSFSSFLQKGKMIFFGDGIEKCKKSFAGNPNAIFHSDFFNSASHMAALAEDACQNKRFEDVAYFEPFYLKDFVVKIKEQ